MIDPSAKRRGTAPVVPEPSESARLTSPLAPPEARSFAREATVALAGQAPRARAQSEGPLSEKEIAIVRALTDALVPPEVRARTGGEGIDVVELALETIRGWRLEYRLALRASLRFIEYAPIIFQVKPRTARVPITPFTSLPDEDRERVCKKLDEAHSPHVRSLFKVAKTLVYGIYYSQPEVSRAVGYDSHANKTAAEAWARSLGR
jgi:hypothetical protein